MGHRHIIQGTCSTSIFKWQFSPTPYAFFHMFQYSIHHYTYVIINLYLYLYQKYTFKIKELIQMSRWNPRSCQRPCSGRCIARIRLLGLGCWWRDFCFKKLSDWSYICWEPGYVKVYKATSGSSQATWSLHYICFQGFVWQLTWEIQKHTNFHEQKESYFGLWTSFKILVMWGRKHKPETTEEVCLAGSGWTWVLTAVVSSFAPHKCDFDLRGLWISDIWRQARKWKRKNVIWTFRIPDTISISISSPDNAPLRSPVSNAEDICILFAGEASLKLPGLIDCS